MAKIIFVTVRPDDPNADDLGWALVVNGYLVGWDTPHDSYLLLGEIADGFAQALGAEIQCRVIPMNPEDSWNWRDILAQLKEVPQPAPVTLNIQKDIQAIIESGTSFPEEVCAAIESGKITPDVIRRAAEIAQDAILEGGYWDYLVGALENAVKGSEEDSH